MGRRYEFLVNVIFKKAIDILELFTRQMFNSRVGAIELPQI